MEIVISEKGRNTGKISVTRSIATMEPGEVWSVDNSLGIENVRVNCSRYGQITGKFFNVTTTDAGQIEVRRAK